MAKNFRLQSGDLVLGNKRTFDTVSGVQKLQQDLQLWLLEKIGTDPSTPTYGSTLDGGVIDGVSVPSYIGEISTSARILEIESEVRRVLEQYQEMQITKMQTEMSLFNGKHTLTADQVLASIDSIETAVVADTILVRVGLTTANQQNLTLLVPAQV